MRITIILVLNLIAFFSYSQIEYDFGKNKDGVNWIAINDGVMGGLSKGALKLTNKTLQFKGNISFENNGGFASFRNRYGNYNLQYASRVEIKYKLAGQIMALSLEPNDRFYEPTYRVFLNDTNLIWKTVEVNMNDFTECILGKPTGNKINSEILSRINRIGFITAEKKEGNFEFEIKYLKFM